MRYFVGISCDGYINYEDISFCHNDLFLLEETLVNFCDYTIENLFTQMIYLDAEESNIRYWYKQIKDVFKEIITLIPITL